MQRHARIVDGREEQKHERAEANEQDAPHEQPGMRLLVVILIAAIVYAIRWNRRLNA